MKTKVDPRSWLPRILSKISCLAKTDLVVTTPHHTASKYNFKASGLKTKLNINCTVCKFGRVSHSYDSVPVRKIHESSVLIAQYALTDPKQQITWSEPLFVNLFQWETR